MLPSQTQGPRLFSKVANPREIKLLDLGCTYTNYKPVQLKPAGGALQQVGKRQRHRKNAASVSSTNKSPVRRDGGTSLQRKSPTRQPVKDVVMQYVAKKKP